MKLKYRINTKAATRHRCSLVATLMVGCSGKDSGSKLCRSRVGMVARKVKTTLKTGRRSVEDARIHETTYRNGALVKTCL